MKSVIIAWCNTNAQAFEAHVPLKFVGQRNRKLGFSNDIQVLFLDGFARLSEAYKADLTAFGYTLHDVSQLYFEQEKKYAPLSRFGDYEKKCFLRWPVIEQFFNGEPIVHYDGDIVFNEDPAVIAKLVAGKTFVLQGCPAFTVVYDTTWFEHYRQQLDLFVQDIEGYSQQAWQQRTGWQVTYKTRWAGSRFREVITSDQDFISHLIHTGLIIQAPVEETMLLLEDYIYFENPLFPHMYDDNFPFRYKREHGIDYFQATRVDGDLVPIKKRVLFWHMQSCFNFYLSKYLLRKRLLWPLLLFRLPLHISSKGLEEKLNKIARRFLHHTNRAHVYRYFFEKKDFSGIFTAKVWWKKGIFE